MKFQFWMLVFLGAATASATDLIVAKGSTASLRVEYTYTSTGNYQSPSKDQIRTWNFNRSIVINAQYTADAPQPFGAMHSKEGGGSGTQAPAASTQPKAQPTMQDMMKVVEKCGQKNQACIAQGMMALGGGASAAAGSSVGNFQLWRLASQTGSYSVDETYQHQVFEMTCTAAKVCKRVEVRKGGGPIPSPAGKSIAGASMFEVDGGKKDMVLTLPVPLVPLTVTQTVTSSIAGDKAGVTRVTQSPWALRASKPMTVAIPGDLRSVSGTKTIPVEGQLQDAGLITVKWQFTR